MRLLIVAVLLVLITNPVEAKSKRGAPQDVSELYQNIGRKLAEVKKMAPACAHKIGSVLDDVDRMYKATSTSVQQDNATMKELETRTLESAVLQKELLTAKQESEILKQTLHEAQLKMLSLSKDIERERLQVSFLKEQNIQLARKGNAQQDLISDEISKLDKQLATDQASMGQQNNSQVSAERDAKKIAMRNQNLNLTSTSEPSSPR